MALPSFVLTLIWTHESDLAGVFRLQVIKRLNISFEPYWSSRAEIILLFFDWQQPILTTSEFLWPYYKDHFTNWTLISVYRLFQENSYKLLKVTFQLLEKDAERILANELGYNLSKGFSEEFYGEDITLLV